MSTSWTRDQVQHNQFLMPWARKDSISTVDAAEMLQCDPKTVCNLIDEGKLQAYRLNPEKKKSPWRVNVKSVEIYQAKLLRVYDLEPASTQSTERKEAPNAMTRQAAKKP